MITITIRTDNHPYNSKSDRGSAVSQLLRDIADDFLNEYYNGEPLKSYEVKSKGSINPIGTVQIDD